MTIRFELNGQPFSVEANPETRLLDLLREHFGLMAAKPSCGIGRCGACTVLADGRPVNACLAMAWQLEGRRIVTAEGLDGVETAMTIRAALVAENAFQCGYCAPGFTIALTALLTENPDIDEAGLRAGLAGNICRCTGYHSILRGALSAAAELRKAHATGVEP
jgi:carbon-monoxide dehydrogenase small subunit